MDELQAKTFFAEQWLKLGNPLQAALKLADVAGFSINTIWIAETWVSDKTVLQIKAKLIEEDKEKTFLPTKHEAARELWNHAQNLRGDDKTRALKLYGEMMGFIDKPAPVSVNQNVKQVVLPDDKAKIAAAVKEVMLADDC